MLKCEIFMSKKFKKNRIIVWKKDFGVFLIEGECECQMKEGSVFQFGEECLNKIFCDTCLNLGLELMKRYCRYKFLNELFFFPFINKPSMKNYSLKIYIYNISSLFLKRYCRYKFINVCLVYILWLQQNKETAI